MLVVSVPRYSFLQQHSDQTHAEPVVPTTISRKTMVAVSAGERRVQSLAKQWVSHDEDGTPTGLRHEQVCVVTLLEIALADVIELDLAAAKGCGFKTVEALRDDWIGRHPRSPRVAVVWFALGDWRDRDVFLNWSGAAGGDYVSSARRSLDPDAPALTHEQMEALSTANRQKDDARRAKASAALAAETPSARLRRLEAFAVQIGDEARRAIRQELRIIEQRVKRAEGRKS